MNTVGGRLYAEFADSPSEESGIGRLMNENPGATVVVFHGCSLREIPRLVRLVRNSGCDVRTMRCGRAALPSDTVILHMADLPETGSSIMFLYRFSC